MGGRRGDDSVKPRDVSEHRGFFDRFAERASIIASRAPFFAFCMLLVLVWAPSYFIFDNLDTWQLVINTATTIITFLMVALLQNSQRRFENAVNHKLNAIADALADFMEADERGLDRHVEELRVAVGLEHREST